MSALRAQQEAPGARTIDHRGDRAVERRRTDHASCAAATSGAAVADLARKRKRADPAPGAWSLAKRRPTGGARAKELDSWERMLAGKAAGREQMDRGLTEQASCRPGDRPPRHRHRVAVGEAGGTYDKGTAIRRARCRPARETARGRPTRSLRGSRPRSCSIRRTTRSAPPTRPVSVCRRGTGTRVERGPSP